MSILEEEWIIRELEAKNPRLRNRPPGPYVKYVPYPGYATNSWGLCVVDSNGKEHYLPDNSFGYRVMALDNEGERFRNAVW